MTPAFPSDMPHLNLAHIERANAMKNLARDIYEMRRSMAPTAVLAQAAVEEYVTRLESILKELDCAKI